MTGSAALVSDGEALDPERDRNGLGNVAAPDRALAVGELDIALEPTGGGEHHTLAAQDDLEFRALLSSPQPFLRAIGLSQTDFLKATVRSTDDAAIEAALDVVYRQIALVDDES